MKIIEYEIKRYVLRVKEFKQKMNDSKCYNIIWETILICEFN
jgi:hypothetical protein